MRADEPVRSIPLFGRRAAADRPGIPVELQASGHRLGRLFPLDSRIGSSARLARDWPSHRRPYQPDQKGMSARWWVDASVARYVGKQRLFVFAVRARTTAAAPSEAPLPPMCSITTALSRGFILSTQHRLAETTTTSRIGLARLTMIATGGKGVSRREFGFRPSRQRREPQSPREFQLSTRRGSAKAGTKRLKADAASGYCPLR